MKKIILAIVASAMLTTAFAQDNNAQRPQRQGRMDRTEMIKFRTDATAKQLGLNEEQTKKLLELNTKYSDRMAGPGMFGGRGMRQGMRPGQGPGNRDGQARPQMTDEQRKNMEEARKKREEANKEYEAELEKILTPEQFKTYKEDQEKRRNAAPRDRMNRQRGDRQRRADQANN